MTFVEHNERNPSRCEMQSDYGLRQKRSRKLEKRPSSFKSAEGKEIFVETAVSARNDATLKAGEVCEHLLLLFGTRLKLCHSPCTNS